MTEVNDFIKGVPQYYSNDPGMPIFERIPPSRKRLYLVECIVRPLLHPQLQSSKFISAKVPTSISEIVSFLVDLDRLENRDDILADVVGVWKNNYVDTINVHATLSAGKVTRGEVWATFLICSELQNQACI